MCQVVIKQIFDILTETNEQEAQMTMQTMAQDPRYAQALIAAQMGKFPDESALAEKKGPKLTKEQVIKAFHITKALTMETMKSYAQKQMKPARDEVEETI